MMTEIGAVEEVRQAQTIEEKYPEPKVNLNWIKRILKWMFNPGSRTESITANEACLRSDYGLGVIIEDSSRIKKLIKSIDNSISNKVDLGEKFCTRAIPKDLVQYKDDIQEHYTALGYTTIFLNQKIKEIQDNILFISWSDKYIK